MPHATQTVQKNSELCNLPGIGSSVAEKLQSSGYHSLLDVALMSPAELCSMTGFGPEVAEKVINSARAGGLHQRFASCSELLEKENKNLRISTGCQAFDDLIGGGVEIGAITEAFGENASGKTQLAYQLAVNNYLLDKTHITLVLDTELRFKASRIEEIAKSRGIHESKVKNLLDSVKIVQVMDSYDMLKWTQQIKDVISNGENVKLVIVDSIMAHFRAEFIGRSQLAERQQKLVVLLHTLNKLAKTYNFAVYLTNHVMSKPDAFFGDPSTHLGGHVIGHFSENRLYLRKGKKGTRIVKLVDSSNMPEAEAIFTITSQGIVDC